MKKKSLFFSFLGTILSYVVLFIVDRQLQGGDMNFGIVSFELAGNINSSNEIVGYWAANNNIGLAAFSIGFDYLFIMFYVSFLCFWTSGLSDRFYKKTSINFANAIIYMIVFAGILDMIENYSLMQVLNRNQDNLWPIMAYYFASIKFVFLLIAVLYNLIISIINRFVSI